MKNTTPQQLRNALITLIAVIVLSTVYFMVAEDLSYGEAIYFSIVTMSSVGYGDILPQTLAGRVGAVFFIVFGAITFLVVVAQATEMMLNRREDEHKRRKLHILVGLFFDETGNQLLQHLVNHLPSDAYEKKRFEFNSQWETQNGIALKEYTEDLSLVLADADVVMAKMAQQLPHNKPLLVRLLENPAVLEHGEFSEMLLAVFHFEQELSNRDHFHLLPQSDLNHLSGDAERVYGLLLPQWLDYLQHLRQDYPYLYSLQVRVNPFKVDRTIIVD